MRTGWRAVKFVAVWMAATGLAIGVSWFGVRPVLDAAVPDRLMAFPVARPVPPPSPSTGAIPTGSPSARGGPRAHPSAPASPTGTGGTVQPPAAPDGWTALGNGRYLRSFRLVGGDATVRAGPGVVDLISATPRAGYAMTVVPTRADRAVVNFTGGPQSSTLDVSWPADSADAPQATVTELP